MWPKWLIITHRPLLSIDLFRRDSWSNFFIVAVVAVVVVIIAYPAAPYPSHTSGQFCGTCPQFFFFRLTSLVSGWRFRPVDGSDGSRLRCWDGEAAGGEETGGGGGDGGGGFSSSGRPFQYLNTTRPLPDWLNIDQLFNRSSYAN